MAKEYIRLKWGVGRMIYESPVTPIVVPIWHVGMDDVLPNEPPYILKFGKKLTFYFGEPIQIDDVVSDLKASNASEEIARKIITDKIETELLRLKEITELLHKKHGVS